MTNQTITIAFDPSVNIAIGIISLAALIGISIYVKNRYES